MIDIENELFTAIASALRTAFPGIYVAGEYVAQPPKFPAVFIVEQDNFVNRRGRSSDTMENFADVMYQVDVFSNRSAGRKAETKAIMAVVDDVFAQYNFTRTFLNPVPNMNDATITRLTGRWQATIGTDGKTYWR